MISMMVIPRRREWWWRWWWWNGCGIDEMTCWCRECWGWWRYSHPFLLRCTLSGFCWLVRREHLTNHFISLLFVLFVLFVIIFCQDDLTFQCRIIITKWRRRKRRGCREWLLWNHIRSEEGATTRSCDVWRIWASEFWRDWVDTWTTFIDWRRRRGLDCIHDGLLRMRFHKRGKSI